MQGQLFSTDFLLRGIQETEAWKSIPAAEHIKQVEKRIKSATPRLELDERDAGGLLRDAKDSKDK